ncbi:Gfo/Idh/MocA family oxidoreductase [Paenibacillus sp. N1-5-1-14]|uniref:Gfo/Idh/MocA family protein n=1 Tax=Paenibacillus radicibacter TaxID=2972488 RepID=UPI002158D7AE|nr:Gfo/Idh/MocA family oxidoreductase [Paenibacillus radicibacter]MCR8641089.1 Gfo/Idh/MocA family oxidoreductase [Paenibacillus radicibacter]
MTKVAVVGAGHWGKNLVRTFYVLNRLAAICETIPSLANQMCEQYPNIPIYSDYLDILDSSISAIVIATPAPTHYELVKLAIMAGKDVFVEKPITLSASEAEHLQQLAEHAGCVLMVGHMLVYQPAIHFIKESIDRGDIGKLHSLHLKRLKLGRVRTVENVLWSLGVHDIAVCMYLTGQAKPDVSISGQRVLQTHIEDDFYLHMQFKDQVQAHIHTSWMWPIQERQLVAVGSQGAMVYNELTQTVTHHRTYIDINLQEINEGSELVFQGESEPLRLECEHFLSCIENRILPRSDAGQGVAVVRVMEQATNLLGKGDLDEYKRILGT